MDDADRTVAILDRLDDHADRAQVVDLGEILAALQLLIDRIEMLWPAGYVSTDPGGRKTALHLCDDGADRLLAIGPPFGDFVGDLFVRLRIEIAQRQVLEVPLHAVDAEAMSQRRVDLERLLGDGLLLGRREALQGAHVVQPVGQLDDDDADVFGHRQEHLAQVLYLDIFLALIRDLRELGERVDERGDFGAETLLDLLDGDDGVFDYVVQQARGDACRVHLELGEDGGHG